MKVKARVPDPRGEQPERLAANEASCGRISLRCASMRRKIALASPGIRGMSAKEGREMRRIISALSVILTAAILGSPVQAQAQIRYVIMIVLENTNAQDAKSQPFMGGILPKAAYLNNMQAVAHPSQPNYLAMVGGSTFGVTDDADHDVNASHLGNLMGGQHWWVYAEDYPGYYGYCFTGEQSGNYVRKHNPFMSFTNVNTQPYGYCANIVNASNFAVDAANNQLSRFSLYIPNLQNDGHDTGVAFADNWLQTTWGPYLESDSFMADKLVIITFDEDDGTSNNLIYTSLLGPGIASGAVSQRQYNHYSLLRLVEDIFRVGSLGRNDATAAQINDIWTTVPFTPRAKVR